MTDTELLHRKWRKVDAEVRLEYTHPKLGGFDEALAERRDPSTGKIQSTARICLSFPVQTEFDQPNLAWVDSSAQVAYVNLTAIERSHTVATSKPFEKH